MVAGLEKMHENEARPVAGASAEEEEASWLKRLSEIERKEERLLDLRGDTSRRRSSGPGVALSARRRSGHGRSRREDFERD